MIRFQSPRQAITVYVAARSKGPKASRMRWEGMPRVGRYVAMEDETLEIVGAILYGPILPEPTPDQHGREHHGGCGVEKGSPLERMLLRWAEGTIERTPAIRNVEIRMRRLLRLAGLMRPATRWVRTQETDGAGIQFSRHVEETLPLDAEVDG